MYVHVLCGVLPGVICDTSTWPGPVSGAPPPGRHHEKLRHCDPVPDVRGEESRFQPQLEHEHEHEHKEQRVEGKAAGTVGPPLS